MGDAAKSLDQIFGLGDSNDVLAWQMALRGALIYVAIIFITRLGKKRFLGHATAFDVVLGVMLGSVASRAITGNAPILGALAACTTMVAMHWLFSFAAMRWHGIGGLLKGHPAVIVRDGRIDEKALRAHHLSLHDLEEELRQHNVASMDEVAEARLERSGSISVLTVKD